MPWLQLAVCAVEQGFVGIVRGEGGSSDLIVDIVGDGRLVHRMSLILLIMVDRNYTWHGRVVEASGGHGGVEVNHSNAETQKGEE